MRRLEEQRHQKFVRLEGEVGDKDKRVQEYRHDMEHKAKMKAIAK